MSRSKIRVQSQRCPENLKKWEWLSQSLNILDMQQQQQQDVVLSNGHALRFLNECKKLQDPYLGRRLHSLFIQEGIESVAILSNHLISLFCSYGSLVEAYQAFDKVFQPDQFSWHAIIDSHAKLGDGDIGIQLFYRMKHDVAEPDEFIFSSILKSCRALGSIEHGRNIHQLVLQNGFQFDIVVGSTLVDMYAECGSLEESQKAFDRLHSPDVVAWAAIIEAYAEHEKGLLALQHFEEMQLQGKKPSKGTFLNALKACTFTGIIAQCRQIHEHIILHGLQFDLMVGTTVINMYAKCGSLVEARRVFDILPCLNVVACCAMITGYVQHGRGFLAIECFENMLLEGVKPDRVTYISILKASGCICDLSHGRQMHEQIVDKELQDEIMVGSTLVDMYAKCGSLEEAENVFEKLPVKNVVTWGAMIAGCTELNENLLALEYFGRMQHDRIYPNEIIYSTIFKACSNVGAIELGRSIHKQILLDEFQFDVIVGNSLIDMYAKCGCLEEAWEVFDKLPYRTMVSWGTMIAGYAQLGEAMSAVQCCRNMEFHGIEANDIVFTGILTAISRTGLVEEGLWYFENVSADNIIRLNVSHATCLLDLLGYAGFFNEVNSLLIKLNMQLDTFLWTTLLSGCRIHCNVELGRLCFEELVSLNSSCPAAYALMSNIYANAHMKDDVIKIETLKRLAGVEWEEMD